MLSPEAEPLFLSWPSDQILVRSTMVQKILRRRTPPILCFPERIFKKTECHGFSVAVPNHPFLYKDEANVEVIGLGEPIFQPQALVTGIHSHFTPTIPNREVDFPCCG